MSFNIAIDGPAGAGKSTVARGAAKELGFVYVDTGAMYRTIALKLIREGVSPEDEDQVEKVLENTEISMGYQDGVQCMFLDGDDVSDEIRTPKVSQMASVTAAQPLVRAFLLDLQRDLAKKQDVLMDGRDIGSTILPDAQLKIYLTASSRERARRRHLELKTKGEDCDIDSIQKEIEERDWRDMHRESSPLVQAKDAVYLDTSDMTQEEVVREIVRLAKERMS